MHLITLLSLGSTKRSSHFKVVTDLSCLSLGSQTHVSLSSLFSHSLDIDILEVIKGQAFTLLLIQTSSLVISDLVNPISKLLVPFSFLFIVDLSEELVIVFISIQLKRVLVVGEQGIVTVCQVSKSSAL